MAPAWLDSLSEDWVSQAGSEDSLVETLPNHPPAPETPKVVPPSRIPKYKPKKQSQLAVEGVTSPLSERSHNNSNIPQPQRAQGQRPSKLREELPNAADAQNIAPSPSSSIQTTQHHTIQHKQLSSSQRETWKDTPEWRKRLLQGDIAYGEQRDLFSPGGLESIFLPPSQSAQGVNKTALQFQVGEELSLVMPSSPPPYIPRIVQEKAASHMPSLSEETTNPIQAHKPRGLTYILADQSAVSEFSANDLSQSSNFRPKPSVSQDGETGNDSVSDSNMSLAVPHQRQPFEEAHRTLSGQSDIRNERLSPILIPTGNESGRDNYLSLDLSAAELQERVNELDSGNRGAPTQILRSTSEPAPGDVSAETEDYAHNGRFVNAVRGSRSRDGSFQKRMLSPSSLAPIDESGLLPEESIQASTPKQLPVLKKPHSLDDQTDRANTASSLVVPHNSNDSSGKNDFREQKLSSGGPLKLFGKHDTFTNQRLLRRLSQFEGDLENDVRRGALQSSTDRESAHSSLDEAFMNSLSPEKQQELEIRHQGTTDVQSFGRGDLDGFQFSDEMQSSIHSSRLLDEDKENRSQPASFLGNQVDTAPLAQNNQRSPRKRYTSSSTIAEKATAIRELIRSRQTSRALAREEGQTLRKAKIPPKTSSDAESKRNSKSPLKDRTPKRRRTLDTQAGSELAHSAPLMESHHQMQSLIGQNKKDAKNGDNLQEAEPDVLATRPILRPNSRDQDRRPLREVDLLAPEGSRLLQGKKATEIKSTDPVKPTRTDLGMSTDTRKGSVTTQDFLDEAKKIMEGIRGKARPSQIGLNSLEESELEQRQPSNEAKHFEAAEDSYQESTDSTTEPFSRPPSREGAPIPRTSRTQEDPNLLDHLRKYEEISDGEDTNALSLRSLLVTGDSADPEKIVSEKQNPSNLDRSLPKSNEKDAENHLPSIRFSRTSELGLKRKHSTSSIRISSEDHGDVEYPTYRSNLSGHSTSRSLPTGSSRGSGSRGVVFPHTVSQLIGDHVAGMVFDSERNMWVKRRAPRPSNGDRVLMSLDETEEDPFENIPDLSVDETLELQRLKSASSNNKKDTRVEQLRRQGALEVITLQDKRAIEDYLRSESSKSSRYVSNGTLSDSNTRPTSWGDDSVIEASKDEQAILGHDSTILTNAGDEEIEKEISIYEDRVESENLRRRRNVTISFSSPVASIIQHSYDEEGSLEDDSEEDISEKDDLEESDISNASILSGRNHTRPKPTSNMMRGTMRHKAIPGHTFSGRPVSRIDERDEESLAEEAEDMSRKSVSVVLSTPRASSVVFPTPRPLHEIGTLTLTPLSDFTMHRAEESFGLEVSYIARGQRRGQPPPKRALSQSIKTLVEKLTEVEPYEPFWEHLKYMELKDKQLTNLHKLDEFCEKIEELDVSNNQISQLNGVPSTVREIRISHNQLTDLTAWGHLHNLQYIDVSNNEIESLSCFDSLIHLRGLRADNNKIKSLDGIAHLDGLLSLRLRGNLIENVDFEGTSLHRLTDLDLKDNVIGNVEHLERLQSLSNLNLEDNKLEYLEIQSTGKLHALKYLKLSGNNLESIDVSQFPNLRLLYLDRNRLGRITGLVHTKHMDSLSMREQQEGTTIDMGFLSEAFEIRKLFLSGNPLRAFNPPVDFLNLQYLELANCGLESLPSEFGQMMSNIRVLNLNFNALRDVKSLAGIVRLKKLHLAGNRLFRLRKTTNILAQFASLALVDLRSNPLTLGFYPPVVERCMVLRSDRARPDEGAIVEPYTLDAADPRDDRRYTNCLDMETRMLRRVYEILIFGGCPRLKTLDGLAVDSSVILAKDIVWEALVEAKLVAGSPPKQDEIPKQSPEEENTEENKGESIEGQSERWQAEDSFA
ncbi:hypothetical protein F5884DRAFT_214487 [Xylogone sp. PMI_703]|nr:hypothetical protein F5884DRAFT_214487 [Xylogone sp. PMI_703]